MAGYSCPECGGHMRHGEVSPGRNRWTCTQCGWDCSEAVAARFLKETPDDAGRAGDLTKDAVVKADAYPPGQFHVEGERDPQRPEGLLSSGERPSHVTNRPLGGDEDMAKRMEDYAESHGVDVVDSNIDAIQAQVGQPSAAKPTAKAPAAKAPAADR